MTWLRLALANLWLSPLTTAVNVLLMGLGAASIVFLLLVSAQLVSTMSRDAQGIDLVVGAHGSPVQLILSAVYHADVPPGNIPLADTRRWADDRRVESSIPLSLGDSVQGFRIVGTTPDFLALYSGELQQGQVWDASMEAVVGASVAQATGLRVGANFAGAHGLAEGGHDHEESSYQVVGVLAPTGSVLDRLVVTSLDSVWDLHGSAAHHQDDDHEAHEDHDEHDDHEAHEAHDEHDDHDEHEEDHADDAGLEITAMLLSYSTPLAATTLPREINMEGTLQAAAPAMEISRLLQLMGVGVQALGAFAWVLVATAALSIFAALYGSLRARRGELAMLRCLGATRMELLFYLIVEGLLLSVIGIVVGLIAGHVTMGLVAAWLAETRGVEMTGWIWVADETWLVLGLLVVGVFSAIIPAVQAYRTDVARVLAEG